MYLQCLSVCQSVSFSIYLFLFVSLPIYLFLYLPIYYLSVYLSICLFVYLSVCLSTYPSICISIFQSASPCERASPTTNFACGLAKALRRPRNVYLTLRKCCAFDCQPNKVLRLPGSLRISLPKRCACHTKLTSLKARVHTRSAPVPSSSSVRRRDRGSLQRLRRQSPQSVDLISPGTRPEHSLFLNHICAQNISSVRSMNCKSWNRLKSGWWTGVTT